MVRQSRRDGKAGRNGPTVVVDGDGMGGLPGRHRGLVVALVTFAFAGAFIFASALLSSCAGTAAASIGKDGGASLRLEASVPAALGAKLRSLSGLAPQAPLFDLASARKAFENRPELSLSACATPDPDSLSATVDVKSLQALLARPDLAKSGALSLVKDSSGTELRIRLERGRVGPLLDLMPGLDRDLVDSLSPPALDPDPLTKAEYRRSLLRPLGETAVAGIDAAKVRIRIEAPSAILASRGGTASGKVFTADIPAFDLLCLENPIELSVRW